MVLSLFVRLVLQATRAFICVFIERRFTNLILKDIIVSCTLLSVYELMIDIFINDKLLRVSAATLASVRDSHLSLMICCRVSK